MPAESDKKAARAQFMDEFDGAKKQIFGAVDGFVLGFTPALGAAGNDVNRRRELMLIARENVLRDITETTDYVPHPSQKTLRGDNAFFNRILTKGKRTPSYATLKPRQVELLVGDEHSDIVSQAFKLEEWQRVRGELKVPVDSLDDRDIKTYFLYRSVLNTFTHAVANALSKDPREYHDFAKTGAAYSLAILRLNEAGRKHNMPFTAGD